MPIFFQIKDNQSGFVFHNRLIDQSDRNFDIVVVKMGKGLVQH